jgi:hypothetical protein
MSAPTVPLRGGQLVGDNARPTSFIRPGRVRFRDDGLESDLSSDLNEKKDARARSPRH